jgi:hypothetical protein
LDSITLETNVSKEDYEICQKAVISNNYKYIRIFTLIITIALAIKFFYTLDWFDLFLTLFIPILFLKISPKFALRIATEFFENNKMSFQKMTYIITDDVFIVRDLENKIILNWNDFIKITELSEFILLHHKRKTFYIFPKSSFNSNTQRLEFLQFTRGKISYN